MITIYIEESYLKWMIVEALAHRCNPKKGLLFDNAKD